MEYSRTIGVDGVEGASGTLLSETVKTHNDADGTFATAVGGVIYVLRYELLFSLVFLVLLYLTRRPKADLSGKQRAARVVGSIVDCCSGKYSKAMDMFFALSEAELGSLVDSELLRLTTALALASIRVGRMDRLPHIFARLGKCASQDPGLLPPVMRMLASRHHYAMVFQVFEMWETHFKGQEVPGAALSCMVHSAVELGLEEKAVKFLEVLKARKEVASRDYAAVIRLYVQTENSAQALAMLREMEAAGLKPDNVSYNMVLSTCSNAKQRDQVTSVLSSMDADVVTYNTRLKACVQDRDVTQAFKVFDELEKTGILATQVTYGTLIECCTRVGDMAKAKEVLEKMSSKGVAKNIVVYTSMIKGYAGVGKLEEAMEVFNDMQKGSMPMGQGSEGVTPVGGLEPDVICYSALIKALCDRHELEQAFHLLEQLLDKGHSPDEILFNHLLAGCAAQPHVQLAEKIVTDMVSHGIKPTTATFSTLMKVYTKAGDLQASVDLLEKIPALYKIMPAQRLYQQHISWAIRSRKGQSAIQVHKMMQERFPDQNADATVLACTTFNMMDTAVAIIEIDPKVFTCGALQQVVDALAKKKKTSLLSRVDTALRESGFKPITPFA